MPIRGVMKGFTVNGMIDVNTLTYPDFNKMISTCSRQLTIEEFELCKSSFPELYEYATKFGYIPESEYDRLGFPFDTNTDGKEVRKDPQIINEGQQRAKELNHPIQKDLRQQKKTKL